MKARAPTCAVVSNTDITLFWRALAAGTPTTTNPDGRAAQARRIDS